MADVTITTTADETTVTDGTGRAALVTVCGSGRGPWGVVCSGDPACRAIILGYAGRTGGVRAGERHLKWHRDGEPRCRDCAAELGRRGATRCRPGRCGEA